MKAVINFTIGGCLAVFAGCGLEAVESSSPPPVEKATVEATTPASAESAPAEVNATPTAAEGAADAAAPASDAAAAPTAGGDALAVTPAPLEGTKATLSPDNTRIDFVCAHVGAKPDPRKGRFTKFSGTAEVDAAAKKLKSVSVEIDTTSLATEFQKLTDHLKSADFFEVKEFPTAKFESTAIEGEGSQTKVTGNLTLHGVTKEISFPATVDVNESGLTLSSKFTIDRSEFGMTFGPDKVENKVSMTVIIGQATPPSFGG